MAREVNITLDEYKLVVRKWDWETAGNNEEALFRLMSHPIAAAIASGGERWVNPLDSKESVAARQFWQALDDTGKGLSEWVSIFCDCVQLTVPGDPAVTFDLGNHDQRGLSPLSDDPTLKYKVAIAAAGVQLGPLWEGLQSRLSASASVLMGGLQATLETFVGEVIKSATQRLETSEAPSDSEPQEPASTPKAKSTSKPSKPHYKRRSKTS